MTDFDGFWRLNAEPYLGAAPYSEAAAQLVFMAYLHKITNGAGHGAVDREYAAGRGRLDLCIRWPRPGGGFDRWAIELKVWRDNTVGDPVARGKEQLVGYLERLGLEIGTLMARRSPTRGGRSSCGCCDAPFGSIRGAGCASRQRGKRRFEGLAATAHPTRAYEWLSLGVWILERDLAVR